MVAVKITTHNVASIFPAGPLEAVLSPARAAAHIEYALNGRGMFIGAWAVILDAENILYSSVVHPECLEDGNEYAALADALVRNAQRSEIQAIETLTRDKLAAQAGILTAARGMIFTLRLNTGASAKADSRRVGE